jgi:hypothetical protein
MSAEISGYGQRPVAHLLLFRLVRLMHDPLFDTSLIFLESTFEPRWTRETNSQPPVPITTLVSQFHVGFRYLWEPVALCNFPAPALTSVAMTVRATSSLSLLLCLWEALRWLRERWCLPWSWGWVYRCLRQMICLGAKIDYFLISLPWS